MCVTMAGTTMAAWRTNGRVPCRAVPCRAVPSRAVPCSSRSAAQGKAPYDRPLESGGELQPQ
jgi:hypothetical protein